MEKISGHISLSPRLGVCVAGDVGCGRRYEVEGALCVCVCVHVRACVKLRIFSNQTQLDTTIHMLSPNYKQLNLA